MTFDERTWCCTLKMDKLIDIYNEKVKHFDILINVINNMLFSN